jgi:hypothetical protein
MNLRVTGIVLFFAMAAVSCFEADEPVPPYQLPENVDTLSIRNSIYQYQVYVDLGGGSVVSENLNSAWALAFECADSGYHIRVNSSDFWGVVRTGSTRLDSVYAPNPDHVWLQDRSDGNPDSTAVGAWVSFPSGTPVYTNEVFLLGRYDGIKYNLEKKVQFESVSDQAYRFLIAEPGANQADTIELLKDPDYNYRQFSPEGNQVVQTEPNKDQWDLLFAQYFTMLYTDDSVPAPYYVRGTLLNPNQVEATLDTTIHFLDITYSIATQKEYSSAQDIIGHDWKSVTVDEATNSAEYKVRPGYTYLVRDTNGQLYKLRFKSYFNKSGIKGYPSIEFAKLEPE